MGAKSAPGACPLHPPADRRGPGGGCGLLFAEGFPRQLIAIFGAANESVYYTDFAVRAFRIYLCMMVLACVNKAAFIFLQAMGRAAESTLLSTVREVVFGVGFALLLRCGWDWTACCTPCRFRTC